MGVSENFRRVLNDQFKQQGIEITDVIITDVQLPATIVQQMTNKTLVLADNAAQKMNQEYEMLTLKQSEEVETLKQRKKEEREKEKQAGDQAVNEVQVQLDKMKAETKVMLNQIKQESKVCVQNITADGNLKVTQLNQEKDAKLTQLRSEAQADAERMKAETELFESTKLSEANLARAQNEGSAAELMAKAEGVAAPYVEARKQFETRQKQMKVWEGLAQNTSSSRARPTRSSTPSCCATPSWMTPRRTAPSRRCWPRCSSCSAAPRSCSTSTTRTSARARVPTKATPPSRPRARSGTREAAALASLFAPSFIYDIFVPVSSVLCSFT